MNKIKKLIQKVDDTEELITEELQSYLEKNEYLKEQTRQLNEYDEKNMFLSANDLQGVDFRVEFDIDKLGLDISKHFIEDAVEEYLDDTGIYYNSKDDELSMSSAEEIFICTHSNTIHFPTEDGIINRVDDFHAWLVIEESIERTGYYPGIYTQDYHGNVDNFKFEEDYSKRFSDNVKTKLIQIEKYLSFYDLHSECLDSHVDVANMTEDLYDLLSDELKSIDDSHGLLLHGVDSISFDKVVLDIEIACDYDKPINDKNCEVYKEGETGWRTAHVTLKLTPNAKHFITTS